MVKGWDMCVGGVYLIAQQNALHCTVNSLHVVLGTHFKHVLLWRQEILGGLL